MVVKIDTYYTVEEVNELRICLVLSGLVSQQEMEEAATFFDRIKVNFLSINDLILPFLKKFVHYSKEERDSFWHSHDSDTFYENLTRRLLLSSPLQAVNPVCSINTQSRVPFIQAGSLLEQCDFKTHSRAVLIQAGSLVEQVNFETHTEYLVRVVNSINHLLKRYGFATAYHEVGFDEDTAFLLLAEAQYQFLITNRVLNFARLEYPEVEVWRKSQRLEDLPF
jgi:hypothetical protein